MIAAIRIDLHDEVPANYRWTDDELKRHIEHAVTELSEAIPLEQKASLPTTNGSRDIDISTLTDRVAVFKVEFPLDCWPRCFQRFSIWQVTLTMDDQGDGSNCNIWWGKRHTTDPWTPPSKFDDVIAIGAEGYALLEWAAFATDRVSVGGIETPTKFRTEGELKLKHFRSELKRLGRRGRLRTGTLYRP